MSAPSPSDASGDERSRAEAVRAAAERWPRSLCPRCAHVRALLSDRGSVFLQCRLAASDARFPRYPPQPVVACSGLSE